MRFSKNIERLSGGKFEIKFFEPGALVPPLECFDAVSKGSIEACWTTPGYHTGKYPALAFFTTVPFGPRFGEFLGLEVVRRRQQAARRDLRQARPVAFDCSASRRRPRAGSATRSSRSTELKGLKMRFFGLGAQVMQKLGVSTQLLAAADIYPALERGVIDATEFSMPTMDIKLGFHQIAKFNYFPGWHQQVSVQRVPDEQGGLGRAARAVQGDDRGRAQAQVDHDTYAETEHAQFAAMAEIPGEAQVQVKRWSDEDLAAFEKAWLEVLEEESAKDPLFKKVADHYLDFRKKFAVWGISQTMKPTYVGK